MSSRATFALGCFWCPEAQFGALSGVIRTRVGYCGGTRPVSPTYKTIGDHSECVQVDFDPQRITYRELLDTFWRWHDPVSQHGEGQYASAIFYETDEQRREAEASKKEQEQKCRRLLSTRVTKMNKFTRAEEYHQKHYLKRDSLLETVELNESITSKLNGYVAGYGTLEQFDREKYSFGLDEKLVEHVRARIPK